MSHVWLRPAVATVLLAAALAFLSGCAALPSKESHWVGINELAFAYPVEDVYTSMVQSVARNGRAIVESDAKSHSLVVSYPFSWLKNGGLLKITCAASEFGTTVTILGDGRDAVGRVRKIGDEVLEDLDAALRRLPRTL